MKTKQLLYIASLTITLMAFENCSETNFESPDASVNSLAAAIPCTYNGKTYQPGESITQYQNPTVPYGQTCVSEVRVCKGGKMTGSYTNPSCTPGLPADCPFNGSTVKSGTFVPAYEAASVAYGSTCNLQLRYCSNGTLSGSFTAPSCTVQGPPQNKPLPPANKNIHIQCYLSAGWPQTLRVTTQDGVAHDFYQGAGEGATAPIDVVFTSPPISFQAFHFGSIENAYRYPNPYTGITDNSVAFETEDGADYDYNDLDCYFSW